MKVSEVVPRFLWRLPKKAKFDVLEKLYRDKKITLQQAVDVSRSLGIFEYRDKHAPK
jgi:hypothetical protein